MNPLLFFGLGGAEVILILVVMFIMLTSGVFYLVALVDILQGKFNGSDKLIWVVVVFFLPLIGTILYFVMGRKQKIQ